MTCDPLPSPPRPGSGSNPCLLHLPFNPPHIPHTHQVLVELTAKRHRQQVGEGRGRGREEGRSRGKWIQGERGEGEGEREKEKWRG